MALENYDFSGWATKNDIKCADGRTIRRDAFKDNDGQEVPLVWGHVHDDPTNVLGHALLVNKPEGVRCYGKFNNSEKAQHAKEAVENGDITSLSIWANKLKQKGGDVLHGDIKEVSLVLAGANIGAFIDVPIIEHSDENEYFEATIYSGEEIELFHSEENALEHADDKADEEKKDPEPDKKEEDMAKEKTMQEIFDTLNEEQKEVVYYMIGSALEDNGEEGEEGDEEYEEGEEGEEGNVEHSEGDFNEMAYNVFDEESRNVNVLSHSDEETILEMAKKGGSFQDALGYFLEENNMTLQHDDETPAYTPTAVPVGGFYQTPRTEGGLTVESLFPDYKDIGQPWNNLITNDQGWINAVMGKISKSPISRVRTGFVDIRKIDALRAKGTKKGQMKTYGGNFELVRRTHDPQTVYVKSALYRDDIIDITDFDYVQYLYNIDKIMMNEELATAAVFGDGRAQDSEDKIFPEHIRPIWLDDELYTMHHTLDMADFRSTLQGSETDSYFGDSYIRAEAMIEMCLYSREKYKGTGTPDMLMHPHELNVMLLARDRNGRRIFSNKAELATSFNVGNIYTCEQMEDKRRTASGTLLKPLAIICNFSDYQFGATKGGELTHFTQFDIDFNQQKSLLETRLSGALTKCWSAIAIEEEVSE